MRKVAAAVALSAGLVMAGATGASALKRVDCINHNYVWVQSNQTTCWADSGTSNVTLDSVYGVSPGNNRGYVTTQGGVKVTFWPGVTKTLIPAQVIKVVHID